MMNKELWLTARQLLELFSVDPERAGATDFIALAECYSVALLFPELGVTKRLLVKRLLRDHRLSPLVFWSRMKRDLLPILSADSELLDSLGLPLERERTCPDLVEAVAAALSVEMASHPEDFREIAERVRSLCVEGG